MHAIICYKKVLQRRQAAFKTKGILEPSVFLQQEKFILLLFQDLFSFDFLFLSLSQKNKPC
jgi:hypothetical protein